jgi:thiol-disulfide isomerase/thioredoxin
MCHKDQFILYSNFTIMKVFTIAAFILLGTIASAQKVPVWKFADLEKQFDVKDSVVIINFWATWCKPCVNEIVFFNKAKEQFKGKPVKFLLVSLDFKKELETRVVPFLMERGVKPDVVLLDEPDYNSWINKVEPTWSGGIPATLMYDKKTGARKFFERDFTGDELISIINDLLAQRH